MLVVEAGEGKGLRMVFDRGLWMMCCSHVGRRGERCWD